MGLDDRCLDVGNNGLSAEVADMLCKNHILGLYNVLNNHADLSYEELREELERDETTIRYNGYSLAFHMMLPVHIIYEKGITATNIDQDEAWLRFVRRETRVQILKKYKKFMQPTKERSRVIKSLIREARDEQQEARAALAAKLRDMSKGQWMPTEGFNGDEESAGQHAEQGTQSGHSTNEEAKRKRKRER